MLEAMTYKFISIFFLVLLVGAWNLLFQHRTCLGVFTSAGIVLLGSSVILMYPAGAFLCDVCSVNYFIPYLIMPFLVFYCLLFIVFIFKKTINIIRRVAGFKPK